MKKGILLGLICIFQIWFLTACSAAPPYEELAPQADFVVYTPLPETVWRPLIREFETRYGVRAEVYEEAEEEIVEQLRMKRENFPGDLILGLSKEAAEENQALLPRIETFSASSFVIIYNKNIVRKREAPERLESLLADNWKGKVGFPNPEKSVISRGLSEALAALAGKEKEAAVRIFCDELLAERAASVEEVARGVCTGRYMAGIVTKALAEELLREGESIVLVQPAAKECIVSDRIVSTIGGKHPKTASLFVEFAGGTDARRYLTEYLKYEPVWGKEGKSG